MHSALPHARLRRSFICNVVAIVALHATIWPPSTAIASTAQALQVQVLSTALQRPWSLAHLPDGRMLVTEKAGSLKLLAAGGDVLGDVSGVPAVDSAGQGGLLDVVLDPDFPKNQRIYLSFSEPDASNPRLSGTAVARARLDVAARALRDVIVIHRQWPKVASAGHFGSRLVFDRSGHLFVTLGDRQSRSEREFAQDPTRGNGKVMRITTEGKPAPGNPKWPGARALPGLWSLGHRNPQGAALHPATGELWVSEHGPQGGDEINRVLAGKNYGWPRVSFGHEYGSTQGVGSSESLPGMEPPVVVWRWRDDKPSSDGRQSSIAPSGLMFYTGSLFPEFKGHLFSGALAGTALWRIELGGPGGHTELRRERLLVNLGERIRDVRQAPSGAIDLLTDSGRLLRLTR